uniref:Uncharacterized protein n=1 Tax=Zea mays TaxID=4577 RepID=A0A804N486_MAIZE
MVRAACSRWSRIRVVAGAASLRGPRISRHCGTPPKSMLRHGLPSLCVDRRTGDGHPPAEHHRRSGSRRRSGGQRVEARLGPLDRASTINIRSVDTDSVGNRGIVVRCGRGSRIGVGRLGLKHIPPFSWDASSSSVDW